MSATGVAVDVYRELRGICGDDYARERPSGGVYASPASAEEVAAILRLANQHRLSVGPAGGSTEYNAAQLQADIVVHTNRLTEIEHYDHADLTVGVGAGWTIAQLDAMVGADRLIFGGDPPLPERCTVGGLLATAAHGPQRHGYGGVRDYCIGIRFVTGDGRRAKGGGRVVKNVAGYDLMKLLIGSYGTLAIVTSASFKLFPAPRQTRTFLAEFGTAREAVDFRDQVMRSPLSPTCLELVSPGARKMMRPQATPDAWVMCVRAAGSDAVLARYRTVMGAAVTRELEGEDERRMWRAIRDFPFTESTGQETAASVLAPRLGRLSLFTPPADILAVIALLDELPRGANAKWPFVGRAGIGHLLAGIDIADPESTEDILPPGFAERLPRGTQMRWSGMPSLGRWPNDNTASMRAVKQALDPNNVLRGRNVL